MAVIFFASTDFGAANHTSRIIEPLVRWAKPDATPEQIDLVHFLVRKTGHLTEYAILGLLSLRAFRKASPSLASQLLRPAAFALLLSFCYAASDEFHQSFVSDRTACFSDVLIDSSGALLSLAAAVTLLRYRARRTEETSSLASPAADAMPQ
jgi:VanZ family protein